MNADDMADPLRRMHGQQLAEVVLIEDDDVDAQAIQRALRKAKVGNPVTRFRDGHAALEFLRSGHHTVPECFIILLDINMPRMTGHEFLHELRADERLRSSVVFMTTTSKDRGDISSAYDKNVAGYIVKDRAGDDFLGLVSMLDSYWNVVLLPEVKRS